MTHQPTGPLTSSTPDDAAQALDQIRHQQERVIDALLVPSWYWWTLGALMVGLAAIIDVGGGLPLATAIVVFVVAVVAISVRLVFGAHRHARVHSELLGERGAIAIIGFVWVVVGLTLGVGFAAEAFGVRYPATIACLVGALALVTGGPRLMGTLRRTMLDNSAGTVE